METLDERERKADKEIEELLGEGEEVAKGSFLKRKKKIVKPEEPGTFKVDSPKDFSNLEDDEAQERFFRKNWFWGIRKLFKQGFKEKVKLRGTSPLPPSGTYNLEAPSFHKDDEYQDTFLKTFEGSYPSDYCVELDWTGGSPVAISYPTAPENTFDIPVEKVLIHNRTGANIRVMFDADAAASNGHIIPSGVSETISRRFYKYISVYATATNLGATEEAKVIISMFATDKANDDFWKSDFGKNVGLVDKKSGGG